MGTDIWYREYLAVAAQLDIMTQERDALREQRNALRRVLERLGVSPSDWSDAALKGDDSE